MITMYRSASVATGKWMSALAFAKQIAAYINDTTGTEVGVAVPVGGNPMRVGWVARYESLGALEATMGKLMADPKYVDMAATGGGNFIAGSVHDEIWRAV